MSGLRHVALVGTVLLAFTPARAAVFTVGAGGTHSSVQSALTAAIAAGGDNEVRIQAGTFVENVFADVPVGAGTLSVSGGWNASFDSRTYDASLTVLDGGGDDGVLALNAAGGSTTIENLTITNGSKFLDGAGIQVRPSGTASVALRHLRIVDNQATYDHGSPGQTGLSAWASGDATLVVDSCTISGNTAIGTADANTTAAGASFSLEGNATLVLNSTSITGNSATSAAYGTYGTGLALYLSDNAIATLTYLLVADNLSSPGPGSYFTGGALRASAGDHSRLVIRDSSFLRNGTAGAAAGQQLEVANSGSASVLVETTLIADGPGTATSGLTAIAVASAGAFDIVNTTITGHSGTGLSKSQDGPVFLGNSIVSGNQNDVYEHRPLTRGSNLIGADPLFVDAAGGDYRLTAASPAVDAGEPLPQFLGSLDLDDNPRIVGDAVDLGAYEYQGNTPMRIAAVAHTTGYGGTPWRTGVAAVNTSAGSASLGLTYVTGSTPLERSVQVPAGGDVSWDDVLVEEFGFDEGSTTSGALTVSGAGFAVTARTYADGGASGTFGQYYPALRPRDSVTADADAFIPLLRSDDDFYTNIGMINTGTAPCTGTVTLYDLSGGQLGTPFTLTAASGRWTQKGKVFAGLGSHASAFAAADVNDGCAAWFYASVVDDTTKDPTTVPVLAPFPASTTVRVPSVAHTTGYGGTPWRTSLAVLNPSTRTSTVTLVYRGGGSTLTASVSLAPRTGRTWHDVLVELFGVAPDARTAGVVEITSDRDVVAASRTYADGGASGTYGQYYPALTASAAVAHGSTGVLPQIRKDDLFYTNIGVLNSGSAAADVRITLRDGTGTALGSPVTRSVAAGAWTQVNDVFAAAGAGQASTAYAEVEVTTDGGQAWFYASVVDDTTKDPTTIPVVIAP